MKKKLMLVFLVVILLCVDSRVYAKFVNQDISINDSQFVIEDESGGGSGQNIVQTTYVSLNSYANMVVGNEFNTDKWRIGLIEHYYAIKVVSIKKYQGVYNNFFKKYYTKSILQCGAVTTEVSQNREFNETSDFTFHLNYEARHELEKSLYVKSDLNYEAIDFGGSSNYKSTDFISYGFSYLYTRKSLIETTYTTTYSLNEMVAAYVPSGYSVSIGEVGTYYIFELKYTEYEIWWWGTNITGSNSNISFKSMLSNEDDMSIAFIYKQTSGGTGTTYYLP